MSEHDEIVKLRAELTANNELYSSDLAAVSLQYDAATALIERLEAAARHDTEAIARLTAVLNNLQQAESSYRYAHGSMNGRVYECWIALDTASKAARAALASLPQGEVRVQAHGPFPGAPFSPKVERS